VFTLDPSVTDGMSTLGCYNRYYNFPIFLLRYFGKSSSCNYSVLCWVLYVLDVEV
jgi:hypothetical protein